MGINQWMFSSISSIKILSYQENTTNDSLLLYKENDHLFLELPSDFLGKDMLFMKHGKYSTDYEIVRWTKLGNDILLVKPLIKSQVGNIILERPNEIPNTDLIIKKFNKIDFIVENGIYKIEVSSLFMNTPSGLPGNDIVIQQDLSFINDTHKIDNELIINTTITTAKENVQKTSDIVFSLAVLPNPMKSRLFDHRMGLFMDTGINNDYSESGNSAIRRWRLEKKDKSKRFSDPTNPIVFYFDIDTPEKWKPFIKAGIEEWLPAFEAAGFSNAIQVKELPDGNNDIYLNSINYSIIRWDNREGYRNLRDFGLGTVNEIVDFRTGEILKSDIIISSDLIYQNMMDEYIVRCAPVDDEAQSYPISDERIGWLIQQTIAHEAGHAFGIMDANYGEYTYPFDKMRSKDWLANMGFTPSIMNYTRYNYVVQPEDSIPPYLLFQKVGPTDIYNIKYAYSQFNNIWTPKDEIPYLEKIIREQDVEPWYKFNRGRFPVEGPDSTDEVVDNNDPVGSVELGLKNLNRTFKLLPKITKYEKDNKALERLYNYSLKLWLNQMRQIVSLIGGQTTQYKSSEQKGSLYTPIPISIQQKALEFIINEVFNNPNFLYHPEITNRFEYQGNSIEIISNQQITILYDLLSDDRLKRMEEMELQMGKPKMVETFLEKLQAGIWNELNYDEIKIDPYKMELQMAYLELFQKVIAKKDKKYIINSIADSYNRFTDHSVSEVFSQLLKLELLIANCIEKSKDDKIQAHLKLCLIKINSIKIQ